MAFLDKEEGEEKKQSAFWDWVVVVGLIILVGGFTFYYQFQKRSSTARFNQADSLYTAGRFREAGRRYEELKTAQYLTTKNDSVIYARLDSIENAQEREAGLLAQSKSRLAAGDAVGARQAAAQIHARDLLDDADRAWLDSLQGSAKTPSSTP